MALLFILLEKSKISGTNHINGRNLFEAIGGLFFPLYKVFVKKPLYSALRYIFHICLIVVPVWLSGHIVLIEESCLGWTWTALPDAWADWMTLLLLGLAGYFFIRRGISSEIRQNSSTWDYFLIAITVLPFVSGYFLAHGTPDFMAFLDSNMWTIHVLSAEAMLLMTVFLFFRIRIKPECCIACAACELGFHTGALTYVDAKRLRVFTYSPVQCICCGACVNACPEAAVELMHQLGITGIFQIWSRPKIREIELSSCERCGDYFAPILQIKKIDHMIKEKNLECVALKYCEKCRRRVTVFDYLNLQ